MHRDGKKNGDSITKMDNSKLNIIGKCSYFLKFFEKHLRFSIYIDVTWIFIKKQVDWDILLHNFKYDFKFIWAVQWCRLELRCEWSHVRSPLYMSYRCGRNLASHHTARILLVFTRSRIYYILSTMNLAKGRTLTTTISNILKYVSFFTFITNQDLF